MRIVHFAGAVLAFALLGGAVRAAGHPTAPEPDPSAWRLQPHVRTYTFYGLNDVNADVPASYMAAHADIIEDDGYEARHADAFKRAGGWMAISYTDPTYDVHCPPPFTPPAGKCGGPMAVADEHAYVHDGSGARIHHFVDSYFQYQEVFNLTDPVVRQAYARWTARILKASPLVDGFRADDSGSSYSGRDGLPGTNLYMGYNAPGVEIRDDRQYIAAESALLAAAGKPVLINGGDPRTLGPAYDGAFIDLPSVFGQMFEGAFNNEGHYLYADGQFEREENGLLAVMAHRKLAICMPTGDVTPPHRLYAYAAWLLTYDPRYSVFATIEQQSPQHDALYPETALVPLEPRQTPRTLADLRRGEVFAREFGACAIDGRAIGSCAAVVNASEHGGAMIPPLGVSYGHHIELDPQSAFRGGRVRVEAGAPHQLAPETAAILVR